MTNQQAYSPYRQNLGIIKSFFAKPLTLIIAIGYALLALLNSISIVHYVNGPASIKLNFDFISIIMSIAFFMLYFSSKSNNTNTSYKAPANMLTIVAIINIVVVGLLILILPMCFAAASFFTEAAEKPLITLLLVIVAIITPVIVIGLIYGISLLLFAGSVKKSVSTVFLYNKGSAALGISSILLAVTSIVSFVIEILYLPTIVHDIALIFKELTIQFGGKSNYEQVINTLNNTTITPDIKSIIELSLGIILNVLLGILALSYRRYINKYTKFIDDGNVPKQPQAEYSAPISDTQPELTHSLNQSDNPYVQNAQNIQNVSTQGSADIICGKCGTHCHYKAVFCPGCGEKLK